jgi:hypothetical protein
VKRNDKTQAHPSAWPLAEWDKARRPPNFQAQKTSKALLTCQAEYAKPREDRPHLSGGPNGPETAEMLALKAWTFPVRRS